ncbi:MAG: hypothetical protein P8Z30_12270 [Acidobacteriota bacterium]
MMSTDEQDILAILKSELEFIEKGGYGAPDRQEAARASTIFADSLTCLNYGYPYRTHPCGECPLMEFVPNEKRVSAMPCHHIPLDQSGRTVEEMEEAEKPAEMQEALKTWLRATISRLESQKSA